VAISRAKLDGMINERLMDVVFPARDQSLGRIVADLSEPETGRTADNLVTNEDSFARVVDRLKRPEPGRDVYLGVGPDQNFTYIAHARPRLAFVLDFRRRNALLHLVHKALFALAHDRAGYLERLLARRPSKLSPTPTSDDLVAAFEGAEMERKLLERTIAEAAGYLRPLSMVAESEWPEIATIQAKLAGPGLNARFLALPMYPTLGRLIRSKDRLGHPAHFLAKEEWFETVRAAQLGDRVIPLVGDFAGLHTVATLGDWLRRRDLTVSTLYVSDVEFFLLRSGKFTAYAANLARLPWTEGAVLIRTSTREIPHPDRCPGDSSTTILRPVAPFLEAAKAGRIKTVEDLFS
jgi:hypothetical protein